MKRKIALLLAIILIATLLPVQAMAASGDKLIALTFDDGPAGSNTTRLLDGLRARNAHCTFFLVGSSVERYPELVKQMWLDGHQIASHTYDHPTMTSLSNDQIRSQLTKTDKLLDKAIGLNLDYMLRPPYGDFNDRVLKTANVPCFFWSMDTYDWKSDNADSVYREFIKQAKDGSLVLLHDTHSTSVTAALRAIDTLQAQGYKFVTVAEMFYRRGITLENGHMYYNAYPGDYGTAAGLKKPTVKSSYNETCKTVTIAGDSRAKIYYTTNGELPTLENSKRYTGPFDVSEATTIKAISVIKWNGLKSDVVSAKVLCPAAKPVISISDGNVSMASTESKATIYYTTDGSTPNKNATPYSESFEAVPGTTYRACAYSSGHCSSLVTSLTYSHNGNVFTDINVGDWCYETVDAAVTKGIFKGVTATEFAPDNVFSRAMLVTVLYRMAGEPDVSEYTEPFTDISEDFWSYDAILWAYNNGIINGYEDGSFRPNDSISRQALCAMLVRYLRYAGKDLSEIGTDTADSFTDSESISASLAEDVGIAAALDIIRGYEDGSIRPQNGATRAQAATMIMRLLDKLDTLPDLQPDAPETEETL